MGAEIHGDLSESIDKTDTAIEQLGGEKLHLLINCRFHPDAPMRDLIGHESLPLNDFLADEEWGELYTLSDSKHIVMALKFCNRIRSCQTAIEIQKLKIIYNERIGRSISKTHDRMRVQGVVTSVMRRLIEKMQDARPS